MQIVADVMGPFVVWSRTGPKMPEEEIVMRSNGNEMLADQLRKINGRKWGLPTPARIAAALTTLLVLRYFASLQDYNFVEEVSRSPTPLGDYARYLQGEAQRAASANLHTVPHPPIPAPVPLQMPPQMHYQGGMGGEQNGQMAHPNQPPGDLMQQPEEPVLRL